jgi:hypothetical protein
VAAWLTACWNAGIPLWHWLVTSAHWLADHWVRREAIWKALSTGDKVTVGVTILVGAPTILVGLLTIIFQVLPWLESRRAALCGNLACTTVYGSSAKPITQTKCDSDCDKFCYLRQKGVSCTLDERANESCRPIP